MTEKTELSKAATSALYRYASRHPEVDVWDEQTRLLANAMFAMGGEWAMRTSSELSPHIARFLEFISWLMERDDAT